MPTSDAHPARPRRLIGQLWLQVLIGTIAGVVLALADPALGVAMKSLGDTFIALVRMLIAPIVFCTVVHGIASMGDLRRAGRVALKAIFYFEAVTTLALAVGLVAASWWQPGSGMNISSSNFDAHTVAGYATQATRQTITDFLLGIIPDTFVSAFTQPNVLQVLLVSVLFAAALSAIGEQGKLVAVLIGQVAQVFFRIVEFVMRLAPIGAFGAIAFTVGKFGPAALASLGGLVLGFSVLCIGFVFVVFGAILGLMGLSLPRLLLHIRDEILVVAATTSTEAVLPRVIEKMREAGCDESVVGLVIPAGYSLNLDGTCLYLATVTLFLAQATGTQLSWTQVLGLMAVMLLTSKGAAGVAGAALVVLAATLSSSNAIPIASIAIILGVHRLLAEGLTFVNLVGNCVATLVVSRWEGAVDRDLLFARLGRAHVPT
jgi:aerobic C4-dicarboxylate transport protein